MSRARAAFWDPEGSRFGVPTYPWRLAPEGMATYPVTGSRVVLTVAHLDHVPENCAEENLLAMCQRCHLAYDADQHAANAARTRTARRTAGMEPLFALPPPTDVGRDHSVAKPPSQPTEGAPAIPTARSEQKGPIHHAHQP
ncbi:hypothetical protein [Bailinhaonella thermotolerans]|uniref:hypothetical protein n=1 Tax=Bailinhaonella thermotolerans TaxID=1070861 RepID=UPI00192A6C65|nr:hypothetical protein [Bailinhaonella thermotolerans]